MFLETSKKVDIDLIKEQIICGGKTEIIDDIDEMKRNVLIGQTLVFYNSSKSCIRVDTIQLEHRGITEPPTSAVIYGPREGFVESIKTNISLVRKRLPTPNLVVEGMNIGRYTKTKVSIVYIKDIADDKVVKRIHKQLEKIDIDGVIDSQYLLEFLEEKPLSIFKQVGKTEKPDVVTAKILEGRVAILVDGSPVVLTVPFIFLEDLQNSDDYYQKSFKITMIRFIRMFGIVIATLLPGIYVAMQLNHYKVLPVKFIVTIMNSTQDLPFTPFIETLFIVIVFELLYEASLRMPKALGIALSVIGALILGDTAVKAGFISPPAVLFVALSSTCFYTVPDQSVQLSFIRMLFTIIGGTFYMLGILVGVVFVFVYLVGMNGYGSPYIAPYSPFIKEDVKDSAIKLSIKRQITRPVCIPNKNRVRMRIGEKKDGTNN